jgi:hypothetical protein
MNRGLLTIRVSSSETAVAGTAPAVLADISVWGPGGTQHPPSVKEGRSPQPVIFRADVIPAESLNAISGQVNFYAYSPGVAFAKAHGGKGDLSKLERLRAKNAKSLR